VSLALGEITHFMGGKGEEFKLGKRELSPQVVAGKGKKRKTCMVLCEDN